MDNRNKAAFQVIINMCSTIEWAAIQWYSGISIKRTPLVQKKSPLYRDVRLLEIFSKIFWPQSEAIRSRHTARLIEVSALQCVHLIEISLYFSRCKGGVFLLNMSFKYTIRNRLIFSSRRLYSVNTGFLLENNL